MGMFGKASLVAAVLALPACAHADDPHVRGAGGQSSGHGISSSVKMVSSNADDQSIAKLDSTALDWESISKAELAYNGIDTTTEDSPGTSLNASTRQQIDSENEEHRAHRTLQDRIMTLDNPCLEDIDELLVMWELPGGGYSGGFLNGGLKSRESTELGVRGLSGRHFYIYARGSESVEVEGDGSDICVAASGRRYCPARVDGGSGSELTYSFGSVCGRGSGYSRPTTTTSAPASNNGGPNNGGGNTVSYSTSKRNACASVDDSSYNICVDAKSTGSYSRDWTAVANAAAKKWETVIKGSLPSIDTQPAYVRNALRPYVCNSLPPFIDDLYICFMDASFDGPGGILGRAGPTYTRRDSGLPINGMMEFDSGDISWMMERGTLEGVMAHEMGHVLGIGTLWEFQGLVSTDGTVNEGGRNVDNHVYTGTNACRKWREITGCGGGGCPPIENGGGRGTAGGHWDEAAMGNELMTGRTGGSSSGMPLSAITAGTLQDLGYDVDYGKVDAYAVTGRNICGRRGLRTATTRVRHLRGKRKGRKGHHGKQAGKRHKKKTLSAAGRAAASEFGKEMLAKAHAERPEVEPEGMVYVADKFVSIIYLEDEEWYSVELTAED